MSETIYRIDNHVVPCSHIRQYTRSTASGRDDLLKLAVKQYTPLDNPHPSTGDITILAAHANGVGKELYEPLWDDLYHYARKTSAFRIRSIWIADFAHQGASGVLNEGKLGNDPSWTDGSLDLLGLVNHFRTQMTRPIIGVGHSMGGTILVNLSTIHPKLFTSLILLDPVLFDHDLLRSPASLSVRRRDVWSSREEAEASFKKNPFYTSWDARVFKRFLEHGFRELPTILYPELPSKLVNAKKENKSSSNLNSTKASKPVTLTTTKHHEVNSFLRGKFPPSRELAPGYTNPRSTHPDIPHGTPSTALFYRPEARATFAKLPQVRPSVLWLFASKSEISNDADIHAKLAITGVGDGGSGGERVGAVKYHKFPDAGHFFPFEIPAAVAEYATEFLREKLDVWNQQEEAQQREWEKVKGSAKEMYSEDFEHWMPIDQQRYAQMIKNSKL